MKETKELFSLYMQLWHNRTLHSEGDREERLIVAVRRELKDELTHPRTRKKPLEKYFLAIKRITSSSLDPVEQIALIEVFNGVLNEIMLEINKKEG